MANEDFVVRFGSNADVFKDQLKRDVAEVNSTISKLRTALQTAAQLKVEIDKTGATVLRQGPPGNPQIRPQTAPPNPPRQPPPQPAPRTASADPAYTASVNKLVDGLTSYHQALGGIVRSMEGAALYVQKAAKAAADRTSGLNRSEAARERYQRQLEEGNATLKGSKKVAGSRRGGRNIDDAVAAALDGDEVFGGRPPAPSVRDIPRAEIDSASLDRLAKGLDATSRNTEQGNKKMDHLIGLINRGITVRIAGGPPGGGGHPPGGPPGGGNPNYPPVPPKGPAAARALDDDPFAAVSQLRSLVKKREREQALWKELARLEGGKGSAPTGAALETLHGGSKSFKKVLAETGGEGPDYKGRVQKALESVQSELTGVAKLKALRQQLDAAIAATGTADGRMTYEQRKAHEAAKQQTTAASTPAAGSAQVKPAAVVSQTATQAAKEEARRKRLEQQVKDNEAAVKMAQGQIDTVLAIQAAAKAGKAGPDYNPAAVEAALANARNRLIENQAGLDLARANLAAGSRAERKRNNREAASRVREEQGPRMSSMQARERLDAMDVAGDKDRLGQRTVPWLRQLAQTYRDEGYDVRVPRGAKKNDLVNILSNTFEQFQAGGRVTKNDLETRAAGKTATAISPEAKKVIGDLVGKVIKDSKDAAAEAIKTEAFQQGYTGLDKGRRGKTDVGLPAGTQPLEGRTAEDAARSPGRPGARMDDATARLMAAEETQAQRQARIARLATTQARRDLLSDPKFDPFAPSVKVEGAGTEAANARYALAAIRRVTDRFDELGKAALRVHNDLDKMDGRLKALKAAEGRADYFSRKNNLTDDDKAQYERARATIKDLRPRVEEDQANRGGLEAQLAEFYKKASQQARSGGLGIQVPYGAFNQANFGVGLDARNASREAQKTLAMQRADAATERLQKGSISSDVTASVRDYLFGARNATNSQGGVGSGIIRQGQSRVARRVDQTRRMTNVFDEEQFRTQFPQYNKEGLVQAQRAVNKYAGAIKRERRMEAENRILEEQGKPLKYTPEQFAAQRKHVDERLDHVYKAYQKATGQTRTTAEDVAAKNTPAVQKAAREARGQNIEAHRDRPRSAVDRSELVALDRILAKGRLNGADIAAALGLSATTRNDPSKINDNFLKAAEARERATTRLQAFESNPEQYAARVRAEALAKAARFTGPDLPPGSDKVAADAKQRAKITTDALRAELVDGVKAATQAARDATTTTSVQGIGPDSERLAREALVARRAQVAKEVAAAEAAEAKARAAATTNKPQTPAAAKAAAGGLSPVAVSRAEAILAGGAVTRDMPMLMGRLAKAAGVPYADYKGTGLEGLRTLLEKARGATSSGAKEAAAAAKAGKVSGFDSDCCEKIVAGLNRIHDAIKGGIRITGRAGGSNDPADAGAATGRAARRRNATFTPEEIEASRDLIRQRRAQIDEGRQRQIDKANAEQRAQVVTQTMREVQANIQLARTLDQLSPRTRAQIDELRRLKAAGADNAQVVKQMEAVYRGAATDLRGRNQTEGVGRRSEKIGQVLGDAVGQQLPVAQVRRLGADIETELSGALRQAVMQNSQNAGPLVEALFGGRGFMSRVLNSTGTFLVRNFTAGFVFGITNALQDAAMQAIDTESTFIRVSAALESVGRGSGGLRTELSSISQDYGVALKDVYTTAAGLTGVTNSNEELVGLTKVATQLQLISGNALNATEAMKALAGVTSAYSDQSFESIADTLTVIQTRLGVNLEDTLEGVARLSGQAVELGLSFENAAVYVGAISKFTNQTGAGAGEQFSRILASLQTGRTQGVVTSGLAKAGVDVGTMFATRNYQGVLTELLETYDDLSKAEQDRIAVAIGGQRQAAAINGLLREGAKINDTVTAATNSSGAAQERAAQISDQLRAKMDRLKQSFINFVGVLVRSGALNFFGVALETIRITLNGVNYALNRFNDLIDMNPVTRLGMNIATTFLGAAVAVAVLRRGILAMLGALGAARIAATAMAGGVAAGTMGAAGTAGAAAVMGAGGLAAGGAAAARQQQAAGRATLLASMAMAAAGFRGRGVRARMPERFTPYLGPLTAAQAAEAGRVSGRDFSARPVGTRAANRGTGLLAGASLLPAFMRPGPDGALARAAGRYGVQIDDDGNVTGSRRGRFFARRSINAENRAARLTDAATRLDERAAARAAAPGAGRVAGAATSAAASAARGGAAASAGIAGAMGALAAAGPVASGAMLGVVAALGLVAYEMYDSSKRAKETAKAYQQVFGDRGRGKKKTVGETDNPFDRLTEATQERRTSWKDLPSVAGNLLLRGITFGMAGKSTDERLGILDDKVQREIDFAGRNSAAGIRQAGMDSERIQMALEKGRGDIQAAADDIMNDEDLSSEQKDTALQQLVDYQNELARSAAEALQESAALKLGIDKADLIATDQVAAVGNLISTITSFPPALFERYSPLLRSMIDAVGFADDSSYTKLLDQLVTPTITPHERKTGLDNLLVDNLTREGKVDNNAAQPGSVADFLQQQAGAQPAPTRPEDGTDTFKPLTEEERARNATPRLKTGAERRGLGIKFLQGALDAAQAGLQAFAPGDTSEAARDARQAAITLAGQLGQAMADDLNLTVSDAQALAAQRRFTSDYEGAQQAAQAALDALRTKREALDPSDVAGRAAIDQQIIPILKQRTQDSIQEALDSNADAARGTRIRRSVLEYQIDSARATLEAAEQEGSGYSDADKRGLRDTLRNLENQASDLRGQEAAAARETALIEIAPGDTAAVAAKRVENARAALESARKYGENSVEFQTATQNLTRALREQVAVDDDILAATSELSIAIAEAAGDREESARLARQQAERNYDRALREAGGNTEAPSVIRAEAAAVRARAAERDAVSDTVAAQSELTTALLEAAGNRVGVARAASAEAERRYQEALANAGGDTSNATVVRADAARVRARAQERDTLLNENIATIDFQREMGEITANTAISMLQELLRQTNLTEEQRRSLRLKIKGLQADIREQLTASGFNIPDQVSLPTAYEVRRSLGLDPYVKAGQARLDDLGRMQQAISTSTMPVATASPASLLASAAQSVVNNNAEITVNNTVSSPAMVEAVARRVVDLIAGQIGTSTRANQTSPALVRY